MTAPYDPRSTDDTMAPNGQKYRLLYRLGGGGMADVYAAKTEGALGFERLVAVKKVRAGHGEDSLFASMFIEEAKLVSKLRHPNIVSVHDFDRDESGDLCLVMELVEGIDLRVLLSKGKLPVEIAIHIAVQVLRGLRYAHELPISSRVTGVIHRDVSPHNVLLSQNGAVKLADFGIARVCASTGGSAPGTMKGKLGYMSPEQAQGKTVKAASDIFSLGIVLHEMLTGKPVFGKGTNSEVLARVLHQPIPSPMLIDSGVPPKVSAIVMSFLERDERKRVSSAEDALRLIGEVLGNQSNLGESLGAMVRGMQGQRRKQKDLYSESLVLGVTQTAPTRAAKNLRRPAKSSGGRASGSLFGYWSKVAASSFVAAAIAAVVAVSLKNRLDGGNETTPQTASRAGADTLMEEKALRMGLIENPSQKKPVPAISTKEKSNKFRPGIEHPLAREQTPVSEVLKPRKARRRLKDAEIILGGRSDDEVKIR